MSPSDVMGTDHHLEPPILFTPDRVRRTLGQYGAAPKLSRPRIYSLCNQSTRGAVSVRAKLELWAKSIPTVSMARFVKRLFHPDQYDSAYGELLVMHVLSQRALEFEYEKPLDGLTPDFLVRSPCGGTSFLLEVYTEGLDPLHRTADQAWRDLSLAIQAIQIPIVLGMRITQVPDSWGAEDGSRLSQEIENWLRGNPAVGKETKIGILRLTVLRKKEAGSVAIVSVGPVTYVGSKRPRGKLIEKVQRYGSLAEGNKMPYVIAYVANFAMATDADTMDDVLFGDTSPFAEEGAALTGVLCIEEVDGQITQRLFINRSAACPLPASVLGVFDTAVGGTRG